jgi:nucleotide-binding universal stress UspA family protein
MTQRILVAVDDSPDALAGTRMAVALAGDLRAVVRAVHVHADGALDAALERATGRPTGQRRAQAVAALLARVAALADAAGVRAETSLVTGEVGAAVVQAAREWGADLIVIGKSGRRVTGEPYVGAITRHVLEFADQPVLVVPARRTQR